METVIIVLQIACIGVLVLGTALSLYEVMQRGSNEAQRFE